jgi:predicted metal-dependent hydrolase
MMPTIEPFFVRSARAALADLDAEQHQDFIDETKRYIAQEAQHHGQHVAFNRLLDQRYRSVATLDRAIGRVYQAVEAKGSQQFNVGFAAASETMAYSAARWAADRRIELFTGADELATTLFLWHLAEEVEHKSVAYDLYWTIYGDRRGARTRYLGAMVIALMLMVAFVITGTTLLLAEERRLLHPLSWIRLTRWGVGFAFELLSNLILSVLPGHHPNRFADPLWYEVWLREFDAESATMPVWSPENTANPVADDDLVARVAS